MYAGETFNTCQDFARGKCFRSSCKYSHDIPSGSASASGGSSGYSGSSGVGSQVCKDFQRGRCSRGPGCRFAHTEGTPAPSYDAVAPYPVYPGYPYPAPDPYAHGYPPYAYPPYAHDPYAPSPYAAPYGMMYHAPPPPAPLGDNQCRDFKHGKCTRGSACKFMHGNAPVQHVEHCRDHAKGTCKRGDSCRFSHSKPPSTPATATTSTPSEPEPPQEGDGSEICTLYAKGECSKDDCKFRHEGPVVPSYLGTEDDAKDLLEHELQNQADVKEGEGEKDEGHEQGQDGQDGHGSSEAEGSRKRGREPSDGDNAANGDDAESSEPPAKVAKV